jgi:hypothetical protein
VYGAAASLSALRATEARARMRVRKSFMAALRAVATDGARGWLMSHVSRDE